MFMPIVLALVLAVMPASTGVPERLVQFRSVDFTTSVVELHNFGDTDVPLDGWRFCTHNNVQRLRYSDNDALNGMILEPGGSLYVHMVNDAPDEPNHLNQSDLGDFALPLHRGPYALGIYWPNDGILIFSDPTDMIDHVQWSVGGRDSNSADERSRVAVLAGLWTAEDAWVFTTEQSLGWTLIPNGTFLQGPDDFDVAEPGCVPADIAEPFGMFDQGDITAFIDGFASGSATTDLDHDGIHALSDIAAFLSAFLAGCP